MFERNRIENTAGQKVAIPVELTFDGGAPVRGKFILSAGRTLGEALNGNGNFVEFEPYGGDRIFVAKSALRGVKAVAVPQASPLGRQNREIDEFDPFVTLGVARGTAFEHIRAAYHRLAKQYHPDRYEGIDLPREVKDYLSAMARRINVAYSALEGAEQAKAAPHRGAAPVYTSPARA